VKYAVIINKRMRNMRVVVVLRKIHGQENFLEKFVMGLFSGKKQEQSPVMRKWVNAK
jgi:hypothetical protein